MYARSMTSECNVKYHVRHVPTCDSSVEAHRRVAGDSRRPIAKRFHAANFASCGSPEDAESFARHEADKSCNEQDKKERCNESDSHLDNNAAAMTSKHYCGTTTLHALRKKVYFSKWVLKIKKDPLHTGCRNGWRRSVGEAPVCRWCAAVCWQLPGSVLPSCASRRLPCCVVVSGSA